MLSEIEIKAHSTRFLCDLDIEDETHETEDTSTESANEEANGNDHPDFPTFVLRKSLNSNLTAASLTSLPLTHVLSPP
jgi:hypothetical protein